MICSTLRILRKVVVDKVLDDFDVARADNESTRWIVIPIMTSPNIAIRINEVAAMRCCGRGLLVLLVSSAVVVLWRCSLSVHTTTAVADAFRIILIEIRFRADSADVIVIVIVVIVFLFGRVADTLHVTWVSGNSTAYCLVVIVLVVVKKNPFVG